MLLPGTIKEVVPASAFNTRGEMVIESRIEHSERNGEKWMSTGELDLLTATLMLDGRYQDSCIIFPCRISAKLTEAFHLYVRFKKMMTIKSNEKMTPQYI